MVLTPSLRRHRLTSPLSPLPTKRRLQCLKNIQVWMVRGRQGCNRWWVRSLLWCILRAVARLFSITIRHSYSHLTSSHWVYIHILIPSESCASKLYPSWTTRFATKCPTWIPPNQLHLYASHAVLHVVLRLDANWTQTCPLPGPQNRDCHVLRFGSCCYVRL